VIVSTGIRNGGHITAQQGLAVQLIGGDKYQRLMQILDRPRVFIEQTLVRFEDRS
jgi:hypothetical protein